MIRSLARVFALCAAFAVFQPLLVHAETVEVRQNFAYNQRDALRQLISFFEQFREPGSAQVLAVFRKNLREHEAKYPSSSNLGNWTANSGRPSATATPRAIAASRCHCQSDYEFPNVPAGGENSPGRST